MSDGEDDLDAQLSALEANAPLTDEPVESAPQAGSEPAEPQEATPTTDKDKTQQPDPAQQRAPLSPEEIAKRYDNTKAALREERQQRRELQRAFDEKLAKFEAALQTRQQPQQRNEPYTTAELLDMGYTMNEIMAHDRDQRIQYDQRVRQETEAQTRAREERERAVQSIQTRLQEFEQDFVETNPDYGDAVQHLMQTWDKQFEVMGYPPEHRSKLIQDLALSVTDTALKQRRDPAHAFYEAAKIAGYARQSQQQQQAPANDKITQIRNGQQAAKTMSGGGAGVQGEGMSLKSIANLEGAAFDAALDKFLRNAR